MDMEKTLLLLNQQIAYARRSCSFYTALPETPLTDLRQLSGFPMVTAEDLSLRGADMLCCHPSKVRRMVTLATSGTTGPHKRLAFTEGDLEKTIDFFHHGMRALCGSGDAVAIFMPGNAPDGLCSLLSEGLRRFGAVPYVYGAISDFHDAARFCREICPQVLIGIPAQMRRLALTDRSLRPDIVLLSADYIAAPLEDTVARCWQCQVYVHYGLTESGLGCAVETPRRRAMEVRPDVLLGTLSSGEIILTTLEREAMPLIRYRTGDLGLLRPDGCLDAVFGRIAELDKPVPIYWLDELLFGLDDVRDFSARFGEGVLEVSVVGETARAARRLNSAFPAYEVRTIPVSALECQGSAKRGVALLPPTAIRRCTPP